MSTIKYSSTSVPASIHLRLLLEHQLLQKQYQQQALSIKSMKDVIDELHCQIDEMKDQTELLEFKFLEQQQILNFCRRCERDIELQEEEQMQQEQQFSDDQVEISRL